VCDLEVKSVADPVRVGGQVLGGDGEGCVGEVTREVGHCCFALGHDVLFFLD